MSRTEMTETFIYRFCLEPDADYITMTWNGYATSVQFREGTEQMLTELLHHKVSKVLGDIENMVLISTEDQQWLLDEFLPKAIAGGFRAIALVQPVHYFNKVAVESVAYKANQEKLRIRVFSDMQSAKAWLQKMDPE